MNGQGCINCGAAARVVRTCGERARAGTLCGYISPSILEVASKLQKKLCILQSVQ